jgi:hypothetical protein
LGIGDLFLSAGVPLFRRIFLDSACLAHFSSIEDRWMNDESRKDFPFRLLYIHSWDI